MNTGSSPVYGIFKAAEHNNLAAFLWCNMNKIDQKIIDYKVVSNDPIIEVMHENLERPDVLLGASYKIKTPDSDHAFYITINDIILNQGTEYEERRPFEIFINSKNMEHFQWVLAMTRLISAIWRKGGDASFIVGELKSVFDPKGGYFKKGMGFMPSLVADIGYEIEKHLLNIKK